jgi:hypothetical protein
MKKRSGLFHETCLETGWLKNGTWTDEPVERKLTNDGGHTALGYSSWQAYCETEFGFGRSQSYRLLEAGRVAELVPHGGMNERQARELRRCCTTRTKTLSPRSGARSTPSMANS